MTLRRARGWAAWAALGVVAACGSRGPLEPPIVETTFDGGATGSSSNSTTTINNTYVTNGGSAGSDADAGAGGLVADGEGDAGSGVCPSPPLLTAASTPLALSFGDQIAAGNEHTCLLATNQVWCWGQNFGGELGDGTQSSRARATKVAGLERVVAIESGPAFDYGCYAARGSHTCALLNDGTVSCWGSNPTGDATWAIQQLTPAAVPGLANVAAIAVGGYRNCALLRDGTASCWGVSALPVSTVGDDAGFPTRFTALAMGSTAAFALRDDGTIWTWGVDSLYGVTTMSAPVLVPLKAGTPVRITAGWGHQCILDQTGTVSCWGVNFHGQLGDGTTTDNYVGPEAVPNLVAADVVAGGRSTCAILKDSTVQCWGNDQLTPKAVPNLDKVVMLRGGMEHWCAIRFDRSVWCWGGNETGQLGDGTVTTRETPVQILP